MSRLMPAPPLLEDEEEMTKEQKEAAINRRMEEMRRKNEAIRKRHEEVEADRREAAAAAAKLAAAQPAPVSPVDRELEPPPEEPKFQPTPPSAGRGRGQRGSRRPGPSSPNKRPLGGDAMLGRPVGRGRGVTREKVSPTPPGDSPRQEIPSDPDFNYLADRSRQPKPGDNHVNQESRRHPGSFGGKDFANVKKQMANEQKRSRAPPSRGGKVDLSMIMTGRERLMYENWKRERDDIDLTRVVRQVNDSGEWRRAWDKEKGELPDEEILGRMEPAKRQVGLRSSEYSQNFLVNSPDLPSNLDYSVDLRPNSEYAPKLCPNSEFSTKFLTNPDLFELRTNSENPPKFLVDSPDLCTNSEYFSEFRTRPENRPKYTIDSLNPCTNTEYSSKFLSDSPDLGCISEYSPEFRRNSKYVTNFFSDSPNLSCTSEYCSELPANSGFPDCLTNPAYPPDFPTNSPYTLDFPKDSGNSLEFPTSSPYSLDFPRNSRYSPDVLTDSGYYPEVRIDTDITTDVSIDLNISNDICESFSSIKVESPIKKSTRKGKPNAKYGNRSRGRNEYRNKLTGSTGFTPEDLHKAYEPVASADWDMLGPWGLSLDCPMLYPWRQMNYD